VCFPRSQHTQVLPLVCEDLWSAVVDKPSLLLPLIPPHSKPTQRQTKFGQAFTPWHKWQPYKLLTSLPCFRHDAAASSSLAPPSFGLSTSTRMPASRKRSLSRGLDLDFTHTIHTHTAHARTRQAWVFCLVRAPMGQPRSSPPPLLSSLRVLLVGFGPCRSRAGSHSARQAQLHQPYSRISHHTTTAQVSLGASSFFRFRLLPRGPRPRLLHSYPWTSPVPAPRAASSPAGTSASTRAAARPLPR
jgi:hypothetical protein